MIIAVPPTPLQAVPAARLAALARGTSIANWFQRYWQNENWKNVNYVPLRDLRTLRASGMTNIRLPLAPDVVFDPGNGAKVKNLDALDRVVARLLSAGLSVTLDFHFSGDDRAAWFGDDPSRREAFRAFWTSLAQHYRGKHEGRLFFEVMNEPLWGQEIGDEPKGAALWWDEQGRLLGLIRREDPARTVIVGGDNWNSGWTLAKMTPYADRNVVYNFHFYDPMEFTHQGAEWAGEPLKGLRNIPFPVGSEAAPPQIVGEAAQAAWAKYLKDPVAQADGGAAALRTKIAVATGWARAAKVPVICNEFGVFRDHAPVASTLRWYRDVRTGLEAEGSMWAAWSYEAGGFSLLTEIQNGGNPIRFGPDPSILRALGLNPPR